MKSNNNNEKLFEAIGNISADKIEMANLEPIQDKSMTAIPSWRLLTPLVAACLIIAIGAFALPMWLGEDGVIPPTTNGTSGSASPTVNPANLPKLDIVFESGFYAASQGEIYVAGDLSELDNINPWSVENNLTTLPVFRNLMRVDNIGIYDNGLTADEMTEKVQEVLDALGLKASEGIEVYPTQEMIEQAMDKLGTYAHDDDILANTTPYQAKVTCTKGIEVVVRSCGWIDIHLTSKTEHYSEKADLLRDIMGSKLMFWFEPALPITEDFTELVFDNSGSLTDKILNYHFKGINYNNCDETGGLFAITYNNTDLSDKVGDYPIITADKAQELLLDGKYHTNVITDFDFDKDNANIAKVELVYRDLPSDEMFMPYYKFLVEIEPDWRLKPGVKAYGAFYVSAIDGDYLK